MSARLLPLAAVLLAGCTTLTEINRAPRLAPVELPPVAPAVHTVSAPHPASSHVAHAAHARPPASQGSIWSAGSRPLHADSRANAVGDLLTIVVEIEDNASFRLRSSRSRDNSSGRSLSGQATLNGTLVEPNGEAGITFGGSTDHAGQGRTQRDESVSVRVAAHVAAVQPNGNLVVRGTQEVRVNQELRRLVVEGVVRPKDITADNTVAYDRMAGARIAYGGRGRLTEVQQPPWGQQLVDLVSPI